MLAAPLNHAGETLGYRLEVAGRVIAYVTDQEPPGGPDDLTPDPQGMRLAQGADVLIHDAQYTDEEYRDGKVSWGHSPLSYVIRTAIAAEVPRLVLFHHDPMHTDAFIDTLVADARRMTRDLGANLDVTAATEGQSIGLSLPAAMPDSVAREQGAVSTKQRPLATTTR